jgi:hypothetical protein
MPLPIPDDHHSPIALRGACTGLPVSAMHALGHTNSLARRLGRSVHCVASTSINSAGGGVTTVTKAAYRRSPGVQVLLVEIELWQSAASNPRAHITASIVGGTASRIVNAGSVTELNGSNDSAAGAQYSRHRSMGVHREWFDVSGLSTGTTYEITVTHNDYASTSSGIRHLTAVEIPMASFDPVGDPANEMGIDPAWTAAGNDLYEGSATGAGGRGYDRAFDQMDKARTLVRRYVQFISREDTSGGALNTNSTSFANLLGGTGTVRTRVRRLRASTVKNPQIVYLRYLAQSGGTLRLVVQAVGQASTNVDITLAATAGSFTSLSSTALALPCDGTDQEVDIKLQAKTVSGANPVFISLCALIEAEV